MAFDAHANFGYSTVQSPAPGLLGTSLIVAAGQGALFPAAPFNCTVWPSGVLPLASNAEIVRVTAVVGDTLTIVRAQEGSSIVNITAGFQIANTTSRKVFTDIEDAVVISAGTQAFAGPFTFADGNGISFGMSNGTLTASVNAGGGQSLSFAAGTQSTSNGMISFQNANNIQFGMDNGTITASANIASFLQAFSAVGGSSSYVNVLTFVNSNGITFINTGGSVAASHNALTSQSNQAVSASNGSFAFQTLSFTNAFNVTFGTSAGGIIFASVATAAAGNSVNFSAGTQSSNLASVVFADSNGIVWGLNNGTITASNTNALTSQSNQAFSASGGSSAFQTLNFANSNGITFSNSNGSVIASHNGLTSQSNQAFSASGGSSAFQTLSFGNSNGITFINSNGSVVASHNGITSQTVQPVAASASNGSFLFSTLNFSNANGVTFGTSAGGIITASVGTAAGGGATVMEFYPYGQAMSLIGAPAMATASVMNFNVPQNLSFSSMVFAYSQTVNTAGNNSSAGVNLTVTLVLLTASAGSLKSVASTTYSTGQTWSSNTTANATGGILVPVPWATSVSPGNYYLAFNMSTAATGGVLTGAATTSLGNTMSMYGIGTAYCNLVGVGFKNIGNASNVSVGFISAVGLNTVTSNLTLIDATNIRCDQSAQRAHIALRFCTAT